MVLYDIKLTFVYIQYMCTFREKLAEMCYPQYSRLPDLFLFVANSLRGLHAYLLVACTLIMTLKDVQYIAYGYQIWGEQM